MKLTVEIELGNDAMRTLEDALGAITRAFADDPLPGPLAVGETARIFDANGNSVGAWIVTT